MGSDIFVLIKQHSHNVFLNSIFILYVELKVLFKFEFKLISSRIIFKYILDIFQKNTN